MPLVHSSSPKALKKNIGTLMGEVGKSPHIQTRAQALRIAYETQRRARAAGGVVPGYDVGGMVDPQQMPPPGMPPSPGVMPQQMPGSAPQGVAGPQMGPPPATGMNTAPAGSPAPPVGLPQGQWAAGVAQNAAPPANPQNAPPIPPNAAPAEQPMGKQLMANGGIVPQLAGGGFSMQKAPSLSPPWQTKAEDRRLHVGPVLSNVPGRTDNHRVQIPSGGYVFPASHVSSLGQGNTLAGMSLLHGMFGNPSHIVRGPGPPKPQRMRGLADGGSPGQDYGQPVPVDISGGEYVASPESIIRRFGDLDTGHKILDRWILDTRKRERKTLANLPGPAKD